MHVSHPTVSWYEHRGFEVAMEVALNFQFVEKAHVPSAIRYPLSKIIRQQNLFIITCARVHVHV